MNKKTYWFFLEPYVHISVKGQQVLLYNTLNGKILEYKNEPAITKTVKRVNSEKNLLTIKVTSAYINSNPEISKFIKDVRKYFMGDLIDTALSEGKPIQMKRILNIQKDVKRLKEDPSRSVGEDVMSYLKEISLYINNACDNDCSICNNAYKQFLYCRKCNRKENELDFRQLAAFLNDTKGSALSRVNVLGGDIFKYSKFEELVSLLNHIPTIKAYFFHYLNLENRGDYLKQINSNLSYMSILIDFPIKEKKFAQSMELLYKSGHNLQITFVIQNREELEEAQRLTSLSKITNFIIQPFYNGRNLHFFKKNVFVNRSSIHEAKPTLKDIYLKKVLNPINFGKIVVSSNGSVHSNVNFPMLGKLGLNFLHEVVMREMYQGRSWRRLRSKIVPCKDCVFELLCPPLSNFEYVIGRNNLCNIKRYAF